MLRDENENFFYQSQTSRRERESRLRQFSREFSRITFIPCLMTDIFKKRLLFSQNFLKCYVLFSREIWIKISFFETRTGISFPQPLASRREGEFHFSISGFETRTRIEIETILARIFGNYIYCLFIDRYFQKDAVIFSKFLKIICLFFSRNLNKNLIFRDENGNFFSTSRVSRREREFFFNISCLETRTGIFLL